MKLLRFRKPLAGIAVAEVPAPAFCPAVDIVYHLTDGDETSLGPSRSSRTLSCARAIDLIEGKDVEIATIAAKEVAVVSQRKAQKVQALTRFMQLDDSRFLAVDGEPEIVVPLPDSRSSESIAEIDSVPGPQSRRGIPHEFGVGPAAGSVGTVEHLLEPMQVEVRQQW